MSSPSKRSTRLSKLDQPQDTKSMDRKQGQVAKLKAGEEKVGTNTPEKSKQKSFIELPKNENSNQKSKSDEMVLVPQTMTTKGSLKKGKAQQALPTPLSAVRRSGRAPVPSSRYKDMEVETPGTSRKRSTMAESSSKEPKVEQEPSKKRFKTLSMDTKLNMSNAGKSELEDSAKIKKDKNIVGSSSEQSPQMNSLNYKTHTMLLEMTEDEAHPASDSERSKGQDDEKVNEMYKTSQKVNEETDDEDNVPISVEEMIQKSLQEGKIDQSDLEANSSVDQTVNLDAETEMSESNLHKPDEESAEATVSSMSEIKENTLSPPPSITIGGQQVTFTEREGETVAIVTISSGLGETHEQDVSMPLGEKISPVKRSISQPLTEVVSVIPNSEGGHTVVTNKAENSTTLASSQSVTVEARQFSSLLRPKARSSNPVTGHGRVIPRNEQQIILKSDISSPSMMAQNSFTLVSSPQTPQPQKGSVTYSLLPSRPKTEASKQSIYGSIAPKGNQKVIIVSQKPSDVSTGGMISTLKTVSQPEGVTPGSGTLSTVIHVKKAAGSALTASDLERVLKALSGSGTSASVPIQTPTGPPATSDEVPESTLSLHTENTETSENNLPSPSAPISGKRNASIDDHIKKGLENQVEIKSLTQGNITAGIDNDQSNTVEANSLAVEMKEKMAVETNYDISTVKDTDAAKQVIGEPTIETLTEEATSDALPVESALYQALQALDPQNVPEEQTVHQENNVTVPNLSTAEIVSEESKPSGSEKWKVKGESIKVVDNGIEYDVRIVSQEDVAEEIIDHSMQQEKTVKQEPIEGGSAEHESGMQTSSTQTLYNVEKGSTIQRMTTVLDKDGQKKQVYYVSVFPGKGVLNKVKSNQGARLTHASWVLSENGMFCCGKCNYKTFRKANFYKHRRLHIGTKPHVCPICQYKAGTSSNLKRHMGIHKDIREHKCEICGLCFRQKIHLERHVKYKHEVKSVHCPLCDYVCANEQPDLKMHMKRKHSSGKSGEPLTCPECQVEVGSKKDLKQHMKFHKDGPELKLFCKECSFVTDCQSRLRRHSAIHSKLKPFQCGVCNYRAAQKEHVLRHLRTQHSIEVKREVKKTWRSRKQQDQGDTKEKGDFTSGDKIFACNHCTMRFAKLINLYKHLHTQHSDIMPPETSGNYFCVVCEFSTTTKKNLLVHMRRHNMTDQTPPTHVYSCVLCRYVNPKRRNLFQHMRKKHNIDVSQTEEETETQVLEMGDVIKSVKDGILTPQVASASGVAEFVGTTGTNTGEALAVVDIHEGNTTNELGNLTNIIKIEDLTRPGASPSGDAGDGLTTLVIDTRGGEQAQITHAVNAPTLIQQQHSADALEGLQALAEQAGLLDNAIEEQVQSVSALEQNQQPQTLIIDQSGSADTTTTTEGVVEIVSGSAHLQELQEGVIESVHGEREAVKVENTHDEVVAGMELSEDQLSSLRHGDMVEMDGELYVVEMANDPDQPNKQILSFVPVSTTVIADQ